MPEPKIGPVIALLFLLDSAKKGNFTLKFFWQLYERRHKISSSARADTVTEKYLFYQHDKRNEGSAPAGRIRL